MNKAEQIIKDSKCNEDVVIISEYWATHIDFHESKTEYFFSDDSSLVVGL